MFGLLFLQFRNVTEALIVLVSVPFALVGSFWTLVPASLPDVRARLGRPAVDGRPRDANRCRDGGLHRRSVPAPRARGQAPNVATTSSRPTPKAPLQRLRPKIMTITTMAVGLLPLLWTDGAGAEIMKRVAAPMLGGLVTSAFLTLEVIPVLYTIWRARQLRLAQTAETPIEAGLQPSTAVQVVIARDAYARHYAALTTPGPPATADYGLGGVQAVSAMSPSANPK